MQTKLVYQIKLCSDAKNIYCEQHAINEYVLVPTPFIANETAFYINYFLLFTDYSLFLIISSYAVSIIVII